MIKWFLKSKTLQVNIISMIATWFTSFVAENFQIHLSAQEQVTILGVLNIILRFVTKTPISLKKPK